MENTSSSEETLVSVIIPIYNVEKYIRKCLDSVVNQTWKNLEIICVNDGTKDASMEIVEDFAKKDSRIVIINIENSGLSVARNTGLDRATGEYVYFLDSDDYLADNAIQTLAEQAASAEAEIVFFGAESVFETEGLAVSQGGYATYYNRRGDYTGVYEGEKLFVDMMKNNDFKPSACLIFLKRAFVNALNVRFYPGILHEDNLFTLQLIQGAERAVVLDMPLYKRLIRESSITSSEKSVRRAYGFYICHRELLSYLGKRDFSLEFYVSLQKYLDLMKKNAVNNISNMSLQEVFSCIKTIDESSTAYFLEYISNPRPVAVKKDIKVNVDNKQNKSKFLNRIKRLFKRTVNALKRLKNQVIKRIPSPVRWAVRMVRRFGFGYFSYRWRLKKSDKICVSIVMPVYNVEKYLRQTLDSLENQTLKNIEIICVDDGSTDSSPEILEEYQSRDKRIRVLHQEKQGAGSARNYGLEHARGEYLLFLDSDDIFDKNLCNEVYYQSRQKKADVCLFGAQRLNMQTMHVEPMGWVLQKKLLQKKEVFSARDVGDRLYQITSGCPWSKMFRRQFVLENGIKFQNLSNTNDAFFVRMNLSLAERITTINIPYVTYRYNEGHNIQSNKVREPLAFYEAFKALKAELEKRGLFEVFEHTYCNMVLTESLFNLRTVGSEAAQEIIRQKLSEEGIDYFGIMNHTADYYSKPQEYYDMQKIYEKRSANE